MFQLKMGVYNQDLELIGLLGGYRSLLYEERAFSAGSFTLDCPLTPAARELLAPDRILWFREDQAGIVEYLEEKNQDGGWTVLVKGRMLTGLLDRRILWGRWDLTGTPEAVMARLVEENAVNPTDPARKLPGLAVKSPASRSGPVIRKQKTGGSLLEALEELGEAYNVAFGVRFHPAARQLEFWTRPGLDHSVGQAGNEPVFFSTALGDVLDSQYTYNSAGARNVALVAGEGEGAGRVFVTVGAQAEAPGPGPKPSRLPDGYTEVEYIQSGPKCGINTGFQVNCSTTRIVMDLLAEPVVTNSEYVLLTKTVSSIYFYMSRGTGNRLYGRYDVNGSFSMTANITESRTVIDCDFAQGKLRAGEATAALTRISRTLTVPLHFFGLTDANTVMGAKLYSAQIYTGDKLERDFVPCVNPSGEAGLYDLAGGQFYGNILSGSFTPGPAV